MPDILISQFDRKFAKPIETNRQVQNISLRDNIPSNVRWEGMFVYVIDDGVTYALQNGIDNSDWVNAGQTLDVTVQNVLTSNSTVNALSANMGRVLDEKFPLYQLLSEKGAANGYAPLGADSKVPSAYLPAYVDDVLEFANLAAFPVTGDTGVLYVAIDTGFIYRWSGSTYIQIGGGGAAAVDSVFGRVGAITAVSTDYASFYLRKDADDGTNTGIKTNLGGLITGSEASSARLQVNGFVRSGGIFIHSGGLTPNGTVDSQMLGMSDTGDLTIGSNTDPNSNFTIWNSGNDGSGSGLDADRLDGLQGSVYAQSGDGLSGDFNAIPTVSKFTSINASANTPFGNAWYTFYQSRHRGGQTDGISWTSQIAVGMTSFQNRLSFRTQSSDVWSSWIEIAKINDLNNGDLYFSGIAKNNGANSTPFRVISTSTGDASFGLLGFYESNQTTRYGYIGKASSGNQDIYINCDSGAQIRVQKDGIVSTSGSLALLSGTLINNAVSSRDKLRVWSSDTYAIGMQTGFNYGGLVNDYAMTFQMNNTATRGFWWGQSTHSNNQGAMALTMDGRLTVANYMRLGYGTGDTTTPGTTYRLQVNGIIQATNFKLSSDRKLKKNIKDLQPRAIPVRWRSFDLKETNESGVGVIADELELTNPEFVTEGDDGIKSVDYIQLLIAKVHELEFMLNEHGIY